MKARLKLFLFLLLAALHGLVPRAVAQTDAGNALRFATPGSATVSGFGLLSPTNEVTIEFWLRSETNITQYLLSQSTDVPTNRLAIGGFSSSQQVIWDFGNTTNGGRLSYTSPADFTNAWTHFAFVASQSENAMRIYRNGVLEASKAGMSPLTPFAFTLDIGSLANVTNYFRGQFDELRIWNVVRTAAEISNYLHRPFIGNPASSPPGLLAYYRFDEVSGTTLNDSSPTHINGTRGVASFTPSSAQLDLAEITSVGVTNIGFTNATLLGSAVARWWDAAVWFEWGPPGAATNTTPPIFLSAGGSNNFSATLSNLTSGSYQFRARLTNVIDSFQGTLMSFQTKSFTDSGQVLPGVSSGKAIWGDYNADGHLDFLLLGGSLSLISTGTVYLYHNNGNGTFTDVATNLPGVYAADAAWGDYDKDGDLDLLISGQTNSSTRITQLFRNDAGVFTNAFIFSPSLSSGEVAWGDFDNDGDLDIVMSGTSNGSSSGATTRVYRNDSGKITPVSQAFTGVYDGSASWADYDGDGWLDFLVTGQSATSATNAFLFRNYGNGFFTNQPNQITEVARGAAASWGYYDSGALPDVLISGVSNAASARFTGLHFNAGPSIISSGLPKVNDSDSAWGDYNNDGLMEFVLTGNADTGRVAGVFLPVGGSAFADSGDTLPPVALGSAAWGDYDNDGDLDLLFTGTTNGNGIGGITRLFDNQTARSNTPPTVPLNLKHYQQEIYGITNGRSVWLVWARGSDAETTNKNWLTYNVRVGTTSGGGEVIRPHADLVTGKLLVPAAGRAGANTFLILTNLNPLQTYYWSVQSVDTAFTGGPWAAEKAFHALTVGTPDAPTVHRGAATLHCDANSFGTDAWGWFLWGPGTGYTNLTAPQYLGNAITSRTFQTAIDLSAIPTSATVYFQAFASNQFGNVIESDLAVLVVPNFELSLNGITNGLAAGQFDSRMVLLTNLYSTNVNFTFTFAGGTPSWVGVSGPLVAVPGVGTGVGLVFNAVNLTNGTYRTTLIIDGGPTTPDARIEVELKVGPEYFLKPGDLNRDGTVDLLELNTVIQYYRGLLP